MKIQDIEEKDLKPAGLTPETSHHWDQHHGFNHTCVKCNKNQYEYGNMGLCYTCVREENSDEKVQKELRSKIGQISIGYGELQFLIEELRFIKRSHESAYYYGARIDFVRNTLTEQINLAFPKPEKKSKKKR